MQGSGPAKLISAISGNPGHKFWPKAAGHEGVFEGQEISAPRTAHEYASISGANSLGWLREGKTMAGFCSQHELHPNQIAD
ncbi:hypothetical protein [Polaromonas sp. CG9_12]|nr:hypothetical protein [Polaromonas sp. CG9_12]